MEMHQVRYFLAVARTLNFTRAAEDCHVTQPSLTRAIQQLEGELGGDLFRRERPAAQLTELGQRMYPLLKQCYESAIGARSLASSIKSGQIGSLRLALSRSVDLTLFVPQLMELEKHFNGLELKLLRGTALEVAEFLKRGEAELAIAATIGDAWERLDRWPLFTEGFALAFSGKHHLAACAAVDIADLRQERFLVRTYCEHAHQIAEALASREVNVERCHEVASQRDLTALLEANLGVAVVPRSSLCPEPLTQTPVKELDLRRTVYLYGVAGRQRTSVATALMKLLRAADWSRYTN